MLEGAVTSVGLDLESDVCFCINVHATSLCTPTEVPPPEVEEGEEQPPPTIEYLYSVCPNRIGEGGELQDTPSEEMVAFYTELAAAHPALGLLFDPMSNEDTQGWSKLAAAMQVTATLAS